MPVHLVYMIAACLWRVCGLLVQTPGAEEIKGHAEGKRPSI